MKSAFNAFKTNDDDETDRQGLSNALRLVFYNLTKGEVEKITGDIYTAAEKSAEESVSIYDLLDFFDAHPEITNERKSELTRCSSAALPQRPTLKEAKQPLSADCISREQNREIGVPQSNLAVEQNNQQQENETPPSQEQLPPQQQSLIPPPSPLKPITVINYHIQKRINKHKARDIKTFGVASRDILADNEKLEAALSRFLANKEVSSKELFYKKLGGINYCITIAATCEQVPSLICTLFEKFAEAKKDYIEIKRTFPQKRIKGKGKYTDFITKTRKSSKRRRRCSTLLLP